MVFVAPTTPGPVGDTDADVLLDGEAEGGDDLEEMGLGLEGKQEDSDVVTAFLVSLTAVAGLGGLLFGLDTGIISGVLVVIGSDLGGSPLTTGQEEVIVSATTVGALFGALLAGTLADWWGRKKTIILASVFFTLGAVEQASANVFKEIVLGRIIVGLGVGLASMVIPVYFAELSPPKYRGRIVTMLVVLITGGQVLAYIIDALFFTVTNGWRWMLLSCSFPALIQLILSFNLPESPRYLILHSKFAPARRTIERVYPNMTDVGVQRKIDAIQRSLRRDEERRGARVRVRSRAEEGGAGEGEGEGEGAGRWERLKDWWDGMVDMLWRDEANRKALIVACGLQFFQQATGFNTLMYYSAKILQIAGFSRPAHSAIFIAVANWICTMVSFRLIDRIGRRKILLYTLVAMTAGLFFMGFSFIFIPTQTPPSEAQDGVPGPGEGEGEGEGGGRFRVGSANANAWAYISLLSMIWFCGAFALGLGNVPWIIQSEIFSYEVRSIGGGFATATNWLANLVVAASFLHLTQAITPAGTFWLYGLICVGAYFFALYRVPETAGLSLEETRLLFVGKRALDGSSTQVDGDGAGAGAGAGAGYGYQALRDEEPEPEPEPDTETDPPRVDR